MWLQQHSIFDKNLSTTNTSNSNLLSSHTLTNIIIITTPQVFFSHTHTNSRSITTTSIVVVFKSFTIYHIPQHIICILVIFRVKTFDYSLYSHINLFLGNGKIHDGKTKLESHGSPTKKNPTTALMLKIIIHRYVH